MNESARIASNEVAEDALAAKLAATYGVSVEAVHEIYQRMDELREELWTEELNEKKQVAKRNVA